MYFFGLSKEEVLSQKHVVSYKETSKQNPTSTVTLFGRQVYPMKRESSSLSSGCMRIKDIDLSLPADHYTCNNFDETQNTVEMGFHSALEANEEKEALATSWSGKRNPKIVIDLEELPTAEDEDSISYVTTRSPETKPSLEDGSDKASDMESGLPDLNRFPLDNELVSEPHYCFLQDLNCPYIEETETSCEKSGIDDNGTTPLCSPKSLHEKEGTASPASDTSCCTTENNLRRGSSSPRASDPSCRTRLEFPVLPEEENFSEVIIQMAAESLVHISSTVSYQNQDLESSNPVSRTNSLGCCSCDSYELHTLGIRETNTEEDLCVSSKARDELNNITRDSSNKEMGLKLRRGRRMKNFLKEILPNLTSLSRHEIREDVNVLEAVLRSREYKKMQGKAKDVANQKNKRSVSQRCVGKRRRKHE